MSYFAHRAPLLAQQSATARPLFPTIKRAPRNCTEPAQSSINTGHTKRPSYRKAIWCLAILFGGIGTAVAQSTFNFVNNITSTPVPGVGHDYIHDLNEIVNPANGALSVRIEAPHPKERGINYPFYSFMYDSTQQFAVIFQESLGPSYNCGPDSSGSDGVGGTSPQPSTCILSVSFPYASLTYPNGQNQVLSGPNSMLAPNTTFGREMTEGQFWLCNFYGPYSYEDAYGVIHDFGTYYRVSSNPYDSCAYLGINGSPAGGDEQYKMVVDDTVLSINFPNNGTFRVGGGPLIDNHGDGVGEDTNGNAIATTSRSGTYQSFQPWGDAFAKTSSRSFAGGATYNYTWGTATSTFSPNSVDETKAQLGFDTLCSAPSNIGVSKYVTNPVVLTMQEPDQLYYKFGYDLTYGLLNQVTYPTGAYVKYTWGVNSLSDATGWATPPVGMNSYNDPVQLRLSQSMNTSCIFRHDTPAIQTRVVSYDGVHNAMQQTFQYSTQWSGVGGQWTTKQTVVTTTDLLTQGQPSFKTIYTYAPWNVYMPIGSHLQSSPLALERTIQYYDTHGSLLRTVTKTWNSYLQISGECRTLPNGKTSGTFYQYESYPTPGGLAGNSNPTSSTTNVKTDVAEYDYGLVSTPCQKPSSTPTREIATTYASFSNTPLWPTFTYPNGNSQTSVSLPPIVDRPATVVTYQNGTKTSETDYGYDQSSIISVSPTPYGHDETNYGNGSTAARGNPTTITRQCFYGGNTCSNSVTSIGYDTTGQPVSIKDGDGNTTQLSYADSYTTDDGSPSQNTNTYVTTITRPSTNGVSHVESFQWDFNKGELRKLTDENLQPTFYQYADPWGRLTSETFPDGGSTTYAYSDAGPNPTIKTNTSISSSTTYSGVRTMDAAGHVIHSEITSDPSGPDYVDSVYDGLGRLYSVTNPYRTTSDPTYGVTTYGYDSLNRKVVQVQPDGSVLQWCYENIASEGQTNCSTNLSSKTNTSWVDASDETGDHWQRSYDSLGRLLAVMEPNGTTTTPSMETDYSYDGLDNLSSVVQNGNNPSNARTRTYAYDSLSRLASATNPESGTITYTYDANGNVLTKTAPAPNQTGTATVVTTYTYDALNRMLNKSYSDGTTPHAIYQYDTSEGWGSPPFPQNNIVGRLSGSWIGGTSAASEIFSYDAMGRVLGNPQCTPSTCGNSSFNVFATYDLAGDLTSTTTAKGTVLSYGYNGAERLTAVTSSLNDSQHPATLYSTDATYGYYPNGAIRKAAFGNGLTETQAYNNRLQPCRINVNSNGAYFSTCTDSVPTGNVLDFTMGYNAGSSDNGNVATWSAVGKQTFSRSYGYDSLNRIQTLSDSASGQACKGLSWTIDAWSNLTAQTTTAGTCLNFSAAVNTNNQLVGYQYDAAGNMTYDGTHHYTYDAENRVIQVDSGSTASYVYDANGRRVRKNKWGGSSWTEYSYGPNGSVQGEYNGSSWPVEYVYAGNQLIAEYTNSTTEFIHPDHLGSTRLVTAVNQSISDNMDYLPFGQQIAGSSATSHKFTGKERDSESGLDMFGARYYGSSLGRFMTPDWAAKPIAVPYANYGNPQSLNLYSYVQNNPTTVGDPDGHCSSPKVGNGQVGVCIDLYIQAKTINVVGQGDNRGPAANDPKATYRTELQLVADPKKGTVSVVKDDAGVSKALGGLVSNKGTSTTSPITPTTDDKGTTHFTVNNTAMNGLHDLPGAPKDSIKTTIKMDVTSEGKVGIEGGMRTAYPSLEIYSYDSSGKATTILQMQEHNPSDLARQDQPIPQVAPQ